MCERLRHHREVMGFHVPTVGLKKAIGVPEHPSIYFTYAARKDCGKPYSSDHCGEQHIQMLTD